MPIYIFVSCWCLQGHGHGGQVISHTPLRTMVSCLRGPLCGGETLPSPQNVGTETIGASAHTHSVNVLPLRNARSACRSVHEYNTYLGIHSYNQAVLDFPDWSGIFSVVVFQIIFNLDNNKEACERKARRGLSFSFFCILWHTFSR